MRAKWLNVFIYAAFFALASRTLVGSDDSRIEIKDAGNSFELSVPVSRLVLSVPKGGLAIGNNKRGATDSARYFYLADREGGVTLSGWFEPARRYTDLEGSWRAEMEHMKKRGFPPPEDVEHSELGPWRSILYNYSPPNGSSAHVRATYIGAGTWIDLHASVISVRPSSETRKQVVALVRSMQVREKQ
jgi:hypothetical protein